MPSYTFFCYKCNRKFEIVSSIRDYTDQQVCPTCDNKEDVMRCYLEDVSTLNTSVKKSDTELKTVGDLANRNRDRMSEGQKEELYTKHNEYKEKSPDKSLPKGFERLSKQPKTKWT